MGVCGDDKPPIHHPLRGQGRTSVISLHCQPTEGDGLTRLQRPLPETLLRLSHLTDYAGLSDAGAPHGLTTTHPDQFNNDLLVVLRS
jgi:hypothetical protein